MSQIIKRLQMPFQRTRSAAAVKHLRFPGVGKILRREFAHMYFLKNGDEKQGVPL